MEKTEGIILNIKQPELKKSGEKKGKKWFLYEASVQLNDTTWHNKTGFGTEKKAPSELISLLKDITVGQYVEIIKEKKDNGFWEIKSIRTIPDPFKKRPIEGDFSKLGKPIPGSDLAKENSDPIKNLAKEMPPIQTADKVTKSYRFMQELEDLYSDCKVRIMRIYGISFAEHMNEDKAKEIIAAVNTMFIQACRERK